MSDPSDNQLCQLPLREQIAQMVVVRASGFLFDHQIRYPRWEPPAATLERWLSQLKVGGVILLGGSAAEIARKTQWMQQFAPTPLLIAADIEEGVGQRFKGATEFPPPMALEAIARKNRDRARHYARLMGAITAKEALEIGINWLLAPVSDTNNNPQNPVINVRAFGQTPDIVADLATAFIAGAQPYPVLTTAKHFPGHGDTATDSHLDLPVLEVDRDRLERVELPPFKAAIAAGVDSIMSAHLQVPVWDTQRPATLSQAILSGQLRQRLGFSGLIVTDALIMGAIARHIPSEAVPVLAIEAGADLLLMPADPEAAIETVATAVESGRLSPERIAASVTRIARAKQKIPAPHQPDLAQLAQPRALEIATTIEQEAMQLGAQLPITPTPGGCNLIVVDDLLGCDFLDRHTSAIAVPTQLGYQLQLVEQTHFICGDRPTLLQLFVRGNPFRGSAGILPQVREGIQRLIDSDRLDALLIYGNPYLLQELRPQLDSFPHTFTYGQTPIAQQLALQALFNLSQFVDKNSQVFT